jgi:hypothetical protein
VGDCGGGTHPGEVGRRCPGQLERHLAAASASRRESAPAIAAIVTEPPRSSSSDAIRTDPHWIPAAKVTRGRLSTSRSITTPNGRVTAPQERSRRELGERPPNVVLGREPRGRIPERVPDAFEVDALGRQNRGEFETRRDDEPDRLHDVVRWQPQRARLLGGRLDPFVLDPFVEEYLESDPRCSRGLVTMVIAGTSPGEPQRVALVPVGTPACVTVLHGDVARQRRRTRPRYEMGLRGT